MNVRVVPGNRTRSTILLYNEEEKSTHLSISRAVYPLGSFLPLLKNPPYQFIYHTSSKKCCISEHGPGTKFTAQCLFITQKEFYEFHSIPVSPPDPNSPQ